MNSLYTLGVRQTNSLQSDLERLRNGDTSASLLGLLRFIGHFGNHWPLTARAFVSSLGQISASLAAMHRTIDDYDAMAKREIIKAKQEKAQMCVLRISPSHR
jgi:Golgi SNAP receptor complex protein 2